MARAAAEDPRAEPLSVAQAGAPADPAGAPRQLAVGTEGAGVGLWDARGLRPAGPLWAGSGGEPVPSLAFAPGREHALYAACGARVASLDARMAGGGDRACVATLPVNEDEVNQVAVDAKGARLAAADDSGACAVVDLERGGRKIKTLRGGHANICSSVQFRARRPWEVTTGGLDHRLIVWDFSCGKKTVVRMGDGEEGEGGDGEAGFSGRMFNPPMVHAVATTARPGYEHYVAAARGDGAVGVYALGRSKSRATAGYRQTPCVLRGGTDAERHGGHAAMATAVLWYDTAKAERAFVLSGGADRRLVLWDWEAQAADGGAGAEEGGSGVRWAARHPTKFNAVCKLAHADTVVVAGVDGALGSYDVEHLGSTGEGRSVFVPAG